VRAASICRHLNNEVLVLRGVDNPAYNRALDHFGVPYVVHPNKADAAKWVLDTHRGDFIVYDDYPGINAKLDRASGLYLWRMNRRDRMLSPTPKVAIEGPGAMWPLLMLDDDEILSKEEARAELGIPQDKFTIIGIPSTARPGVVEATDPDFMLTPDKWWPALRWMRAADHIVGCPGANLWGEVAYLGTPVTWIKAPNAPDQAVRIKNTSTASVRPNAALNLARMIDGMHG
jgi:hypothetical protein